MIKQTHKCKRCDWEWESKLKEPASCPKCKRYDWNKDQLVDDKLDQQEQKQKTKTIKEKNKDEKPEEKQPEYFQDFVEHQ